MIYRHPITVILQNPCQVMPMKIQSKEELTDKENVIKEYMAGYMRKNYPGRVYEIEFTSQVIIEETRFLEGIKKDNGPEPFSSPTL